MKFNYKHILVATALIAGACDVEEKLPYPEFADGVSFRAIPAPYISRPQFSAADPGKAVTYNFFSYNADNVSKADIFVSYLPTTAVPAALGTVSHANYIVQNNPAGIAGVIAQVPESGNLPPTFNYQRYAQLIAGSNLATPAVTFPATPRVLLRTIQGSELANNHSFTLNEVVSALGIPVPTASSSNIANQAVFFLTFEVYDLEGNKYSYLNGSPSILAGGPQGRAVAKTFVDNTTTPPTNRAYQIMLTGNEGSPFTPGASIRLAP
jgi:hypothetical protein